MFMSVKVFKSLRHVGKDTGSPDAVVLRTWGPKRTQALGALVEINLDNNLLLNQMLYLKDSQHQR